jgi:hypothetical protein
MRKASMAVAALTLLVAGFVLAQVTTVKLPTTPQQLPINDKVALRVEGTHDGRVYGTLVVNVDGKWVDVQLGTSNVRAGR